MNRISLVGWPIDERDSLTILARRIAEEHFNLQSALLQFHLQADSGEHIPDGTYMRLLVCLTRLSLLCNELRVAILTFRTTAKMPAVQNGGDLLSH